MEFSNSNFQPIAQPVVHGILLFFTIKFKFPALLFFFSSWRGKVVSWGKKNRNFINSFAAGSASPRLGFPNFYMRREILLPCKFGARIKNTNLYICYAPWDSVSDDRSLVKTQSSSPFPISPCVLEKDVKRYISANILGLCPIKCPQICYPSPTL